MMILANGMGTSQYAASDRVEEFCLVLLPETAESQHEVVSVTQEPEEPVWGPSFFSLPSVLSTLGLRMHPWLAE